MLKQIQFQKATPESCGIPSAAIGDFTCKLQKLDAIHSFMLMRDDKIIAENYWEPFKKEYKHELFSCSKSFVSAAFGIAAAEKLISIDDKLTDFFPDKLSDKVSARMREVTMRHLLTMSSGHEACPLAYGTTAQKQDWVKAFLESELAYKPGTKFVYNSAATYMISAVLRKVTGMNILDYLNDRIFRHIGINADKWDCCPSGINIGGWGLWLTTEDMLRFGYLLLKNGNWDGKQLIPADYLQEATSFQIDNSSNQNPDWKLGYGYQFWRTSHNSFRADGACGQYILVIPDRNMVMAMTSGVPDMQRILTAFFETVYASANDKPLPENPAEYRKLQETFDSCSHPPVDSPLRFPHKGGVYELEKNSASLRQLAIDFTEKGCSLTFISENGNSEKLCAGYGCHTTNFLRLGEAETRILAASCAWRDENELDIQVYALETPFRDHYYLRFKKDGIELERASNFNFLHNPMPLLRGTEKSS